MISPHKFMIEDGYAEIVIYTDDVCVYRSPSVTQKTMPFKFEADIKGAQFIKFTIENNSKDSDIILTDVMLNK